MTDHPTIVPREKLDFGLDEDIPRFWFAGDPFKTRFIDAMSTTFPEGERFFICCVRDFRDQVADPKLLQEIKDFIRQEGQHGIVHRRFNDRLRAQGIDVDRLEGYTSGMLFGFMRRWLPKKRTLASTAACEHLTAIMAQSFFERREVMEGADPRIYAMYAWHAMEEMEHKAVAFDVMQKVAEVGYIRRVWTLVVATIAFPIGVFMIIHHMLRKDGQGLFKRIGTMLRGAWWLYKPGGLYAPILGHYLQYFKPGFHPWQIGQMQGYDAWIQTYERTKDPILAGDAALAAGSGGH